MKMYKQRMSQRKKILSISYESSLFSSKDFDRLDFTREREDDDLNSKS